VVTSTETQLIPKKVGLSVQRAATPAKGRIDLLVKYRRALVLLCGLLNVPSRAVSSVAGAFCVTRADFSDILLF
jgi:hypothetical protein